MFVFEGWHTISFTAVVILTVQNTLSKSLTGFTQTCIQVVIIWLVLKTNKSFGINDISESKFPTYIAEANWVVAAFTTINAIGMAWTCLINSVFQSKVRITYCSRPNEQTVYSMVQTHPHYRYQKPDYTPWNSQMNHRLIYIPCKHRRILRCISSSSHTHWSDLTCQ